jgi:hypothetical protein
MVVRRCRSADAIHLKGGYWEPIAITTPILDHKNGHDVKPNRIALKYPDFKEDVDLDVHVRVFNSVININT